MWRSSLGQILGTPTRTRLLFPSMCIIVLCDPYCPGPIIGEVMMSLQELDLPLANITECQDWYRPLEVSEKTIICAEQRWMIAWTHQVIMVGHCYCAKGLVCGLLLPLNIGCGIKPAMLNLPECQRFWISSTIIFEKPPTTLTPQTHCKNWSLP